MLAFIGPIGAPEFIFILVIALLIFGPRKLPEIGRTLGKGLGEFRRATNELKRTLDAEMIEEELRKSDPRQILKDEIDKVTASAESRDPAVVTDSSEANVSAKTTVPAADAPVARGQLETASEPTAATEDSPTAVDTEDEGAGFSSSAPDSAGGKTP